MSTRLTEMVRVVLTTTSLCLFVLVTSGVAQENPPVEVAIRPVIAEEVSPLETINPVAADGHRGEAFLRKPPGDGPFPAVLLIHGGLGGRPSEVIRDYALSTHPSRYLEAGYVIAAITYRDRSSNPQSTISLQDALATVDYLKGLSYVDPSSIVVNGTSGGGDLTLEVAAATEVAAIAPEEPASFIMSGLFTADNAPGDGTDYVLRYRTAIEDQTLTGKIARIGSPILIIQGDGPTPLNRFNAEVLIPELRAAGKSVEVNTYRGEPHSFTFYSTPSRTPRPAVALEAFQDIASFFRIHISTQPTPVDSSLVTHAPFNAEEN